MIITETITRKDGVKLIRRYSDSGYKLKQDNTNVLYDEAVDVTGSSFNYIETDIPVNDDVSDEEALRILLGGDADEATETD